MARLPPGISVLEIGAGMSPLVERPCRPTGIRYVGLAWSHEVIVSVPTGAYDEVIVNPAGGDLPRLSRSFDLVLAWDVLHELPSASDAIRIIRSYLHPGAMLLARIPGSNSFPSRLRRWGPRPLLRILSRLSRRDKLLGPVPCRDATYRDLTVALSGWSTSSVWPYYVGARGVHDSPLIRTALVALEERRLIRGDINFASHYFINAVL